MKKKRVLSSESLTRDGPDWSGISFKSTNVGALENEWLSHQGYYYCTHGELELAKLLSLQGVPFTPDVKIVMPGDKSLRIKQVVYVVDFIFNGDDFIWTDSDGRSSIIHGFEAKGSDCRSVKANLLYSRRGIKVLVLSEAQIDAYVEEGELPLRPVALQNGETDE